jgi:hypothetical protein
MLLVACPNQFSPTWLVLILGYALKVFDNIHVTEASSHIFLRQKED